MTTTTTTALQLFQPPVSASLFFASTSNSKSNSHFLSVQPLPVHSFLPSLLFCCRKMSRGRGRSSIGIAFAGKEDTQLRGPSTEAWQEDKEEGEDEDDEDDEDEVEPTPDDLEYISQIKRILELLKKNRDMLFNEVKLTVMIEDPRELERRRLLGIDESEGPTRDDLVAALEEVNEGKVPKDRLALRMLAEEMIQWPNLEVEAPKKQRSKSLYAKATDTGIDPKEAAKRLNMDWDSAADIEEAEVDGDADVPPAVGYGALYLVTAFPIIIGISVVLILFYNSLQ
ncbi:hypothetical protein NMG60_11021177 [Bertholletia excelsa]